MTVRWIIPHHVFHNGALCSDVALHVTDGVISAIVPLSDVPDNANAEHMAGIICPGFIDLQVNGGGGVLLNHAPNLQGIRAIIAAHRGLGTTAIMPTVITDTHDVIAAAADAAIEAKDDAGFAGLHIEGPHISMAKRGTHDPRHIRPMDNATMGIVAKLCDANVKVVITVAPEAITPTQITALAEIGAIVSIGHTDAISNDVATAFEAGATVATHLFNAMSPMQGRAAGAVGAVINSTAFAGVICDGHHVSDEMIGLAIRARPVRNRMFLVSDAMPTVGGPDNFSLYDQEIQLIEGKLVNADGNLAGAHVTMAEGLARLVSRVGLPPEEALKLAITVPASVIGRPDLDQLTGRNVTDLVVLNNRCQMIDCLRG